MNPTSAGSRLVLRATCATLLALATLLGTLAPASRAAPAARSSSRQGAHRLQPFDLVKLQVFQEPDLDRELRVSQDYKLVVPLVGVVDVRDRTVRDAGDYIADLFEKDFLVNPQVNLTVIEYAQRTINVLGAVNTPGSVVIPPEREINLLDAIARAGGFSRLANRSHVSLTRTLASGESVNFTINADQLLNGDSGSRWPLQDGDVISVPERLL